MVLGVSQKGLFTNLGWKQIKVDSFASFVYVNSPYQTKARVEVK